MSSIRRIAAPHGFQSDIVIPPRIGPAADGPPPPLAKRGRSSLPDWPPLIDTRQARHAAFCATPPRGRVNWYFVAAVAAGTASFILMIIGGMAAVGALWAVLS